MLRRCVLGLLLSLSARAQADLAVDHSTLPNGLDLLLHVDRKAPIVRVNVRIHAGSKHEPQGKFGIAHFVEHLFYQDRDGVPFSVLLDRLGATNGCGDLNEDFTEYCETVPSSRLERLLWMESNRFALFLSRNLTQQNLDRQREVVINEKRERTENAAYARVRPLIEQQLFPPGHPYAHSVGGEYADLRSVTLDDVRAFYAAHYTSDQMSIAIAGDFDQEETKRWVVKYFGSLAPADVIVAPVRSAPPLPAPKFVELVERVRDERAYFAWIGPPDATRDSAALEFAAFFFGDDYSPRNLYKAIGDQLVHGVSMESDVFQDASIFCPYVTVTPGASIAAIEDKLTAELARLGREGPTEAEMTRARDHLNAGRFDELESLSGLSYAMQQVHQIYVGIDHWRAWAGRYDAVTAADVRAAVTRWLVMPSHLTLHVVPQNATHPEKTEPDRSTPPAFQPEKPYHPPEIQTAKLPNGLELFLLERHDLPKVAVRLQFRVGSVASPPDKPMLAMLAAATAGKDNKTADGVDAIRALSDLDAQSYGDADLNAQDFGFTVPRKNLELAFRIAAISILQPVYPEWSIEAFKRDWIREIEHPDPSLDNYARELYAAAFGPDHPLGRGLGTAASIRSLTAADVRAFHDRYWKPDVAALVFAGDITLKDAVALSDEVLGGWTGAAPPTPTMPAPRPKHDHIVFVDRRGVTQTMVLQVLPAVPRDHPDFPALYLANDIYGGASGRVWENIRQRHGIAYWAHSGLTTFPGAGLWTIQSPVQQDSTLVAMREFEKELAAFGRSEPITQEELDQVRTAAIRNLPEEFETLGGAAGTIAWNWAQGLPLSELEAFPARLAAVTVEEVNAIARKYARPDQAFFVLVGDREKIEPQVRDFR